MVKKNNKPATITRADFVENFLPKKFLTEICGKGAEPAPKTASQRGKEIIHDVKVKFGL